MCFVHICYLCNMKLIQIKKFVGFWLAFCLFFIVKGQVVINEYSAANYDSFQDNYGEYEDWVEIYNTSAGNTKILALSI